MEIENSINNFFLHSKNMISLNDLIHLFKITEEEIPSFYQAIFNLEQNGKIYFDEKNNCYYHVPKEFYLTYGILQISKKNNYYINLKGGNRITIPKEYLSGAKVGDAVFVKQEETSKGKHEKNRCGKVIRVVRPPIMSKNSNYQVKATILKDYKNNSYYFFHENKKISISNKDLNGAFSNDLVSIQISKNNEQITARVIEVLERKQEEHVFELKKEKWIPIESSYFKTRINSKEKYDEGTRILAKIEKENDEYLLTPIKTLSPKSNIYSEIEVMSHEKGFSKEFSQESLIEVEKLPIKISSEELAKRKDLRNLPTITIDPANAKDLDDAISLEKIGDIFRLYVHIADIDYYANYNTPLFEEALKRGISAYPYNLVIPMFPEKLSNVLCSLNPNEDKLTKTITLDIDMLGNIIDFSIDFSIINSNYKMKYDAVDDLLTGKRIESDYIPFYQILMEMNQLSNILQKRRMERGFVCFNSEELEFKADENGNPISISEQNKGPARLMIENFMLIANEVLTEYAYWLDIPFVYRNHESPSDIKVQTLSTRLQRCSNDFKRLKNIKEPKMLQRFLLSICKNKSPEEVKCISDLFLQSMSRAYLSHENKGHYGLALNQYGTFTSPIRKGSDLLNHLVISEVLRNGVDTPVLNEIKERLPSVCKHLSEKQYDADCLEIDVNYLLLKEFSKKYYEQEIEATVVFLMEDRILLQTNNLIPGIVCLDKNYHYDKFKNIVINNYSKEVYHIGDKLIVKIKSEDSSNHKMIFDICYKLSLLEEENNKVIIKKRGI